MSPRETVIIDGKAEAAALRGKVASEARRAAVRPHLAIILVGEDPASHVYVRNKMAAAAEADFRVSLLRLPADVAEARLHREIVARSEAAEIDGILLQLPLPDHLDRRAALSLIAPGKDVDGLTPVNAGLLAQGVEGGFAPCTPLGCVHLAKVAHRSLEGMEALVVGRSELVGRPLAALLLREDCTVTAAHSRSRDLAGLVGRAELLFVAAGVAELVRGSWVREGATVVDVGIHPRVVGGERRLVGDVARGEVLGRAGALTPVPGGVGPMTVAYLLRNLLEAALRR